MFSFWVNLCLVTLHMGSNSVEASPFDGEVLFDSSNLIHYEMPLSCKGMTFCFDKGEHYPQSTFDRLLDQMPVSFQSAKNLFSFFLKEDVKGNPDCPATFSNKPIYYILDENDKVRAVAQSPKFQQIYSTKWCQRPGRITEDTPHFLKGSRTLQKYMIECVDRFMDVEFLVLSDEYGDLKLQLAQPKGGIPVCCRCRYSKRDTE